MNNGREPAQLVVFSLDGQRHAVALSSVERIVRAVEVTPLPNAPAVVLGAIDVAGSVLPVFNLRRRLGLPERVLALTDQFLIARTAGRRVVLVVDEAQNVIEHFAAEIVATNQVVPGLAHIPGVLKCEDGLVLIHDLDAFLSPDEALSLDEAMQCEVVDGP